MSSTALVPTPTPVIKAPLVQTSVNFSFNTDDMVHGRKLGLIIDSFGSNMNLKAQRLKLKAQNLKAQRLKLKALKNPSSVPLYPEMAKVSAS